ncbi:hypothetical protein CKA32_001931 [Geitlerinema sp. FC II]|nr:hypothetical protein CKA32_001931 [Geitlerinema sp. FC II]
MKPSLSGKDGVSGGDRVQNCLKFLLERYAHRTDNLSFT